MPKPLVAVETIYDAALDLLDERGAEALSARNLAAALKCSTRTLYQQVGKREALVAQLIAHYLAGRDLVFERDADWRVTARNWSLALRGALLAHSNLARLMTTEHREPIADYATELLKALLAAGFERPLALRSVRVLVNVVINLTISEIITTEHGSTQSHAAAQGLRADDLAIAGRATRAGNPPETFDNTLRWLLIGIAAERDGQ
ncbi:MAG: TetR family transcriptional regulator [Pseudomonadota bacterium]